MATKSEKGTERLFFNGVDGATGDYGLPPMTGEELSRLITGESPPENLSELKFRHQSQGEAHLGVKEGVDPKKLDEAGWGVVFAHDADPAIEAALEPLLRSREEQAGDRFRRYSGDDGYRSGETKPAFLARHGVGPGPADPDRVPYYLLLVGGPESIPYRFQSQLDVQHAVGRIHFDSADEYASYAQSVVEAEREPLGLARELSFFGVSHPGDRATELSLRNLVEPLVARFEKFPHWNVDATLGDDANKASLTRLIGGDRTPALVFAASHGVEFPLGDSRQLPHQGALLCRDWPGPEAWRGKGPVPEEHYLAGDDIAADAQLLGLVGFFFACYGGGTPERDDFTDRALGRRRQVAPRPFVASLPRRMLSHPRGGALAVIAHVDRAWGYSFHWSQASAQTTVFESALERLLSGHPVGSALEFFDERYAELSTVLSDELEEVGFGKKPDPLELARLWTANNDARGVAILGDPAVRLPVAAPDETPRERPAIELRAQARPETVDVGDVSFSTGDAAERSDDVSFRAYHPRATAPNVWRRLLVYAHLSSVLNEVELDAGRVLGRESADYKSPSAPSSLAIAPGTEITLVARGEDLEFDPKERVLTWNDAWQRTEFRVRASEARAGHVARGSIECFVGPLLVAEIGVDVVVIPSDEAAGEHEPGQKVRSARMYRSVFASYSHADERVVEAVERAYEALGMDYLRDVMVLRSGESWSDELLRHIDEADVFQLFWSKPASESAFVEQEWRHALRQMEQKGASFIRPVYWEDDLAPVPRELSRIHFARVDFGSFLLPAPIAPVAPLDSSLMELTVSTWSGEGESATLVARTRIRLDGDVDTHVFESELEGEGRDRLLTLHRETLRDSLSARLDYLRLLSKKS